MLRLCLAAILIVGLHTQTALAAPRYCTSNVRDDGGQSIRVTISVDEGVIQSRQILWRLPIAARGDEFRADLEINYYSRTSAVPEEITGVTVVTFASRDVGLRDARATLMLSPERTWSAPFNLVMFIGFSQIALGPPWGERNIDLIQAIGDAGEVDVTIRNASGRELAAATLNPSDHAMRDRLRAQALQEAERLAASPEQCS